MKFKTAMAVLVAVVALAALGAYFFLRASMHQPSGTFKSFSWSGDVRLTHDDNASMTTQRGYNLAVSENTLYLVWLSEVGEGNWEIYLCKSTDLGKTWRAPVRLTDAPGEASYAALLAQGSRVYLTWSDNRDNKSALGELYFKRSVDCGETWSEDVRLTEVDEHEVAIKTIAASGGTVYLAWEEKWNEGKTRYNTPPFVLFYKSSADGGRTWGDTIQIQTDTSFETGSPSPIKHEDELLIVYGSNEVAVNNWELFSISSTEEGLGWSQPTRLTIDQNGDSRFPVAVGSGAAVHVVWWDDRDDLTKERWGYPPLVATGNYEIYYKRFTDMGWGPDTRLTHDGSISRDPTVAAAGQDVYVVWADNRDGNYEIYFKQSNDGGTTWSEDVRLTNSPGRSYYPSVAVDGEGNIHVAWWDERDGNLEVYYKKGTVVT